MKFNFYVNKYLLIWNILYQNSITEDIQKVKQKLWNNNKKEYSLMNKDKAKLIKEANDYIPDDDNLYNLVEITDAYKKIKQETNKYRLTVLEIWTTSCRKYLKTLNKILKFNLDLTFDVFLIHPNFDIIEMNFEEKNIVLGKKTTLKEKDSFLIFLIFKILENELKEIKENDREIYNILLELVCINELYSKVSDASKYNLGNKTHRNLKNKIYPYWLMYLGIAVDDMEKCMIRDNLFFDISEYEYNKSLKDYDIYSFARFIIKNKQEILNKKTIGIEKIKVETL